MKMRPLRNDPTNRQRRNRRRARILRTGRAGTGTRPQRFRFRLRAIHRPNHLGIERLNLVKLACATGRPVTVAPSLGFLWGHHDPGQERQERSDCWSYRSPQSNGPHRPQNSEVKVKRSVIRTKVQSGRWILSCNRALASLQVGRDHGFSQSQQSTRLSEPPGAGQGLR